MRKIAIVLGLVLMVSIILVACQTTNDTDSIIGTWTLTEIEEGNDPTISMASQVNDATLEIKEDNVAIVTLSGMVMEGTYVETADAVTITIENIPEEFIKIDGKLVAENENSGEKIYFTR